MKVIFPQAEQLPMTPPNHDDKQFLLLPPFQRISEPPGQEKRKQDDN